MRLLLFGSENLSDSELSKRLSVVNESPDSNHGSIVTSPVRSSDTERGPGSEPSTQDNDTERNTAPSLTNEQSKLPMSPVLSDDSLSTKSVSTM